MRRAALLVAAMVWAPSAGAAGPSVAVHASPGVGPAPLHVTLSASGDAASYRWDFGDGTSAEGTVVEHVYATGAYTARVTAASPAGETAQAEVAVTAFSVSLATRGVAAYGRRALFRGRLTPAVAGARVSLYRDDVPVASGLTRADGRVLVHARPIAPGAYQLRWGNVVSNRVTVTVRPRLDAAFVGSGALGQPLALVARLRPASAGAIRLALWRDGKRIVARTASTSLRLPLPTSRSADYVAQLSVSPRAGFASANRALEKLVYRPFLRLGSTGTSVRLLEGRLAALHYALATIDGSYDSDTMDAVVAFEKVRGLARTGVVTPTLWRQLDHATAPWARFGGDHIEVDKRRQVLFVVRNGRVTLVAPVSTGATGNTPLGRWHVYSKVPGWNGVLWYPMFFVGAFAIHGYPSVPPYPASHGCVRVPMWVAPRLFSINPYGETVDIYE